MFFDSAVCGLRHRNRRQNQRIGDNEHDYARHQADQPVPNFPAPVFSSEPLGLRQLFVLHIHPLLSVLLYYRLLYYDLFTYHLRLLSQNKFAYIIRLQSYHILKIFELRNSVLTFLC